MHYGITTQAPGFAVASTGAPSLIPVNLFHSMGWYYCVFILRSGGTDFLLLQPDIALHLVKLDTLCQQPANSGLQRGINLRTRTHNIKDRYFIQTNSCTLFNPLNPELNPICYLLALLGAHHFLHVSRIRVKLLTFRLLMSYIYIYIYIYIWSTHS